MQDDRTPDDESRRDFLRSAGLGAAALGLGLPAGAATAPSSAPRVAAGAPAGPYNILFFLVDQERRFRPGELPVGLSLPARERLARQGTTFVNHRINSCVCTP